jgi:hypothetical protein
VSIRVPPVSPAPESGNSPANSHLGCAVALSALAGQQNFWENVRGSPPAVSPSRYPPTVLAAQSDSHPEAEKSRMRGPLGEVASDVPRLWRGANGLGLPHSLAELFRLAFTPGCNTIR